MKYHILALENGHSLIEYISDNADVMQLWVRVDPHPDGTPRTGEALDEYLLSFAPDFEVVKRQEEQMRQAFLQHVDACKIFMQDTLPQEWSAVVDFCTEKHIDMAFLGYKYTVYNASTKQEISHVFSAGDFFIKAFGNAVLEYYEAGVAVDGEKVFGVSRDLVTGEVIDVYRYMDGLTPFAGITKTDPEGITTDTFFFGYEQIPEEYKSLLDDFEPKASIGLWSPKPYGFVVEYAKFRM